MTYITEKMATAFLKPWTIRHLWIMN